MRILPKPFSPRELIGVLKDCAGVRFTPGTPIVPSKTLRLVLAEDNHGMALTFATLLRRAGHRVTVAHDGLHALQMSRAEQPDVALLDIGLPRMDGYEVARQLRQDSGLNSMWLIAVTSHDTEADLQQAKRAGFDHHYVKPIDFGGVQRLLCGLGTRLAG